MTEPPPKPLERNADPASDPCALLARARGGDSSSLGRLLDLYRNYLRLLARSQIGDVLRLKLEASDVVQEAFLEAHRGFAQFQGQSERELLAWLRRILVRNLADQARGQRREKRDLGREESLEVLLERSSVAAHEALAASASSPSAQAIRREQAVLFADALATLPDSYQEVMTLRHLDRLGFEEIAARLGVSSGAVRMLWVRAMEMLRRRLEADP